MAVRFCSGCGKPQDPSNTFCPQCGRPLSTRAAPVKERPEPRVVPPVPVAVEPPPVDGATAEKGHEFDALMVQLRAAEKTLTDGNRRRAMRRAYGCLAFLVAALALAIWITAHAGGAGR